MNERPESTAIREALATLGLNSLPDTRGLPFDQRVELLEQWKTEVLKPRFKQLVRELHPDRGGDTGAMAKVNAARDLLDSLKPREEASHGRIVIFESEVTWSNGTATSSTSFRSRRW